VNVKFGTDILFGSWKEIRLDSVISPDYAGIGNMEEKGARSFLHTVQAVINAFRDIQWIILDMMADGD
jgi:hypothetical protein